MAVVLLFTLLSLIVRSCSHTVTNSAYVRLLPFKRGFNRIMCSFQLAGGVTIPGCGVITDNLTDTKGGLNRVLI
jgi:hypothetical protein